MVSLVPLVENLHMYELTVIYYKSGTKTTVPPLHQLQDN